VSGSGCFTDWLAAEAAAWEGSAWGLLIGRGGPEFGGQGGLVIVEGGACAVREIVL